MPSASERTLRGRIAAVVVIVAVVGAIATALVIGALSWSMAIAQEDRRLNDLLGQLDRELELEARDDRSARAVVIEEQHEIEHTGVRLAVYRNDLQIGGDFSTNAAAGCRTIDPRALVRECVVIARRDRLVARTTLVALAGYRQTFVWALLGAVAIVSALAAWVSRRVAARSLEPLTLLRDEIDKIDVDRPDERSLGPATGYVELDALRSALERAIERLSESLAQARRFAFNAAHEMRTPLTALRAEAELHAEQGGSLRVASLAEELSRRMDRVLVLADSRLLHAGEAVSLEAVTEDVCAELSATSAVIERDVRDEGLVRGDGALLGMLLRNAIENSVKFGAKSVRVGVEKRGDVIELSVEDDGPGVAEEERRRMFEPFVRGEAAKRAGVNGQGLGLALIAHIARIHGGEAAFDSGFASGARLIVRLPGWR